VFLIEEIKKMIKISRRAQILTLGGFLGLLGVQNTLTAAASVKKIKLDTKKIESEVKKIEAQMIGWRRHIHQNPELGNREFETAALVAKELRAMGIEVTEKIAFTGVKGVLKGAKPGPVVALRADMDALPVPDKSGLAFASKATGLFNGQSVPVTHACGHDAHVAMLLGAASVLSKMKSDIAGTIVFIFQPAEEGPPAGEEGGAALMVKEGVLTNPKVQSIFGLHVGPGHSGTISYRPKGFMATADQVRITLKGTQAHGAQPWKGTDLSALTSDIIQASHQITARQIDVTEEPTVFSLGVIHGGLRWNILPEDYVIEGTLRTFSADRRTSIIHKFTNTVNALASAYGVSAQVEFITWAPLTYNDPILTADLYEAMTLATGSQTQVEPNALAMTGAEDFSQFQKQVPGTYVFLGITEPGGDPKTLPGNHSPYFVIHEPALATGVKAHIYAAFGMIARLS
jgi:amidohydrolase